MKEINQIAGLAIAALRQGQFHRKHAARLKAKIQQSELPVGADGQDRAGKNDQRDSDFRDYEHIPQSMTCAAQTRLAAFFFECRDQVCASTVERWRYSEQNTRSK